MEYYIRWAENIVCISHNIRVCCETVPLRNARGCTHKVLPRRPMKHEVVKTIKIDTSMCMGKILTPTQRTISIQVLLRLGDSILRSVL